MTYSIAITYWDSPTKYTQSFSSSLKKDEALRELREYLDVPCKDEVPVKPTFKTLKKNLGQYADDEWLRTELKRETESLKVYRELETFIESGENGRVTRGFNSHDVITVGAFV